VIKGLRKIQASKGDRVTVSASMDVLTLTAQEIAAAIAGRQVTPSEVAELYLARIAAVEDKVQAWCYLDADDVRAQAEALTREVESGTLRGPLHGVPIGIKDEFHVAGMPTYMADPTGAPQPEDATPVARMRAAGAIIMGKTHMPIDGVMPPTRNPWNLEHTAGGTSSGSGAAVGARMVPLSLGEQTAGSNLRPAAFCGIEAIKPTFGRISKFGCYPFSWSHDHVGLMGLNMEDIALLFSVVAGQDSRDQTSLAAAPPEAELQMASMRPPTIGVVRNFFPERTEPEMQEAIENSVARMRAAGATVNDYNLPTEFGVMWGVHRVVGGTEGLTFRSSRLGDTPGADLAPRDLLSNIIPTPYYLQAQRIRAYLWEFIQASFASYDAILLPVAPGAAPKGLQSTGDTSMLVPWSSLGYPAITVNGGLTTEGLPLGLQFVTRPMDDYNLMRLGSWASSTLGRLPAPEIR
jgi:aspartyl-tRNA(Asn)/glutamyl-tRNA(Gln) amidotransferase subunit A